MNHSFSQDIAAAAGLDTVPHILDAVCRTTGLGFAAVARPRSDRWIACAVRDDMDFGIAPGGELRLDPAVGKEMRRTGRAVAFDHDAAAQIFRDPRIPRPPGVQSCIAAPIRRGGALFGVLCAVDARPDKLRYTDVRTTLEIFADMIGHHLDAHARLAKSEAALSRERDTAELREQFIAVLGHDLRNPLAAIEGGASILRRNPDPDCAGRLLDEIQGSVTRMAGMIDNVLDFARGRLGGGFDLIVEENADVAAALAQVVAEFRAAQPGRRIETDIAVTKPVPSDARRLAQLTSNLIANALTHGATDTPVRVAAHTVGDVFELSVRNAGAPIDPNTIEHLFHPFTRASARPGQQGLGLGLYIASEIAHAHGGGLTVTSDMVETQFSFRMPL